MSRDIHSMLAYEAKRRPAVAALVERAPYMTDAEIDAAEVPMPWFRRALKALAAKRRSADTEIQTLVGIEGRVRSGFSPDPMGFMRRWTAGNTWLPMGRGHIEILTGQLLWLPQSGGVWLDTVFSAQIAPITLTMSEPVGEASRLQYKEAFRAYRSHAGALAPKMEFTPEVGGPAPAQNPLAAYGVRFSR